MDISDIKIILLKMMTYFSNNFLLLLGFHRSLNIQIYIILIKNDRIIYVWSGTCV